MGFNVKLATSGIAGVTNLQPGIVTFAGPIARNSINVLSDGGTAGAVGFTVSLPLNPLSGTLVEFKNLLTEFDVVNNPGETRLITINPGIGVNVDGRITPITTITRNEVFKLIYVNLSIGWLVL